MLICWPGFVSFITRGFARAITLWPFIFLNAKSLASDTKLVNHERIHLRQQLETGVILFYLWYLTDYLYFRLRGNSHYNAYRLIRFEKEAFDNESNLDFLKTRKFWNFLRQ